MRTGKLTQTAWRRSVRRQLRTKRDEVISVPLPYENCSGIRTENGAELMWADACAAGNGEKTGFYAMIHAAGDLAAKGTGAAGVSVRVMLPEGAEEDLLRHIAGEAERACAGMNIQITAFQGEVVMAAAQPLIYACAAGVKENISCRDTEMVNVKNENSAELLMCGYAGLEGTLRILSESRADLSTRFTDTFLDEAERLVPPELKAALELAHENIRTFHAAQRFESHKVEVCPGVTCWQKSIPIEKVGLYIPGGTAPLFSTVLMLATPAKIAGCREIVLCTPPDREGKVNPAILCAARVAGVDRIFKAGGVQAIGAMAFGPESIPRVYKIFGPGNQYVTAAKQWVSLHGVAIDLPAGPSEVEVLADESANPVYVAADLLSQAEHGVDSQAMLITTSSALQQQVKREVERQLPLLSRHDIASQSLKNSKLVLVHDMQEALALTNEYAPEHLIIESNEPHAIASGVINAGSVFLGHYAPESAGDYASGTNHTLPTNGYAKAYSGVCLDSFVRKITFQEITHYGLQTIGTAIETMAEAEGLDGHKRAVSVRLGRAD